MARGDPWEIAGLREGEVLAGKYRVERVLGVGGMGAVVAAHHVQLETRVALKFLLPATLEHPEAVGRFAREARAAVKITSEHVARVFDVGTLESGAPYLVMEFLEGVDLGSRLRQRGPLQIEQAVDFVLQASVAIADAHSLGIVHRDLKPANLFCVPRNDGTLVIKVLDFGISKTTRLSASDAVSSMTQTSAVMGSPLYMSPEQMQSTKDVDAQTDIWAIGVTLYELVTGAPPFTGESYAEIAIRVATAPLAPLRSRRPDAPAGLEEVVGKCLAKDKSRRFSDMAALAEALAAFGSPRSRASVERIVGILRAAGFAAATQPQLSTSRGPTPPARPGQVGLFDATTVPPEASSLASLGTMAPSATTAARGPRGLAEKRATGEKRRRLVTILGAVSGVAIAGGVGLVVGSMGAPVATQSPLATSAAAARSRLEHGAQTPGTVSIAAVRPAAAVSALPETAVDARDAKPAEPRPRRASPNPSSLAATVAPAPAPWPTQTSGPALKDNRAPSAPTPDDSDPLAKLQPK